MKVLINSKAVENVALLVWQHNPFAKNWANNAKEIEDKIKNTARRYAREWSKGSISLSTGGYTLTPYTRKGRLTHIQVWLDSQAEDDAWEKL